MTASCWLTIPIRRVYEFQDTSLPATLQLVYNGKSLFTSHDADLAQAYFGIWLGEPPLSAQLKADLLAAK